jgi:hypothetical protein
MEGMSSDFDIFARGILDSLLLFLVIPFSIPTFIGYHFLTLKRNKHAGIAFIFSFLIALVYIAWIGFLAILVIFFYISVFYLLVMGPFWLLDKLIKWYENKYVYEKYKKYLDDRKTQSDSNS